MHREVCKFANVLKARGIATGDRVALYMPLVPELAIAMLACARIGATHTIIFGGFSADSIRDRVNDCGCKLIVTAGDFTVRGGSAGSRGGLGQELAANVRAREWRIPYVRLLDAAGGSVRSFEELGRTYLPDGNVWTAVDVELLSQVPVVSAVMGSVAGLPAINACLAHFNLMVKDKSQLFPGGPPVVKAALGYDITKEELGGDHIHVKLSGSVENLASDEGHAFELIRQFLSYLPSNVWEMPPRGESSDDPNRREEKLLSLMPRNPRQIYDPKLRLNLSVDQDSFF